MQALVNLEPMVGFDLRYSAAKRRRDAGEGIETVSLFLDHSNLAVTTTYLGRLEGEENNNGWRKVGGPITQVWNYSGLTKTASTELRGPVTMPSADLNTKPPSTPCMAEIQRERSTVKLHSKTLCHPSTRSTRSTLPSSMSILPAPFLMLTGGMTQQPCIHACCFALKVGHT